MSTRPTHGTLGKPLRVTTNSFMISQLPRMDYIQYDAFSPEVKNSRRRQEIIHKLQIEVAPQTFTPRAVYDGRFIMYSSRPLPLPVEGGSNFTINFGNPNSDKGNVIVRITRTTGAVVRPSDLKPLIMEGKASQQAQVATNLMQLLIRQAPNQSNPNNGRSYFTPAGKVSIGGGLELWRGYFQSVRPTLQRMLVNIDTSMAAMHQDGHVLDIALAVLNKRDMRDLIIRKNSPEFRKLEKHFKKLQIIVESPGMKGRKKMICGLQESAGSFVFDKDGSEMTIAQYFQVVYNYRLKFPMIFGIVTTPKSNPNPTIIPAEFCKVLPGQIYKGKIPEELAGTGAVQRFTTVKPAQRLEAIVRGVAPSAGNTGMQSPVLQYERSDFIMDSGMVIDKSPMMIDGRVLDPPQIKFGPGQPLRPKGGAWNVVGQRLNTPMRLLVWGIVNFQPSIPEQAVHEFQQNIAHCCNNLGMVVNPNAHITVGNGQVAPRVLTEALQRIVQGQDPKMMHRPVIIVILPQNAAPIRAQVKLWGDVKTGVITQCVRENKIYSRGRYAANDQYCNNVCIKLNARLGGTNAVVDAPIMQLISSKRTMIMGADVGHPGPGSQKPSITSLVFSHDQMATQYAAISKVQRSRQEIIEDLEDMVCQAIDSFGKKNNAAPESIIFFRDGVSEGEFQRIADTEITAIEAGVRKAFVRGGKPKLPMPPLTFIVVGKRHHIRFFPNDRDADRTGNCPPGFVADKGLQSPVCCDFYLQSHGGLLGTSRPSHYIVLRDDNFGNHVDKLQALAYALCHVYAKATRSVSIPAPVYYADLVCSRASFYFDPSLEYSDSASASGDGLDIEVWKSGYSASSMAMDMEKTMYFL